MNWDGRPSPAPGAPAGTRTPGPSEPGPGSRDAAPRGGTLSVVIPALNEEVCLPETLRRVVGAPGIREVLVVDGGSDDTTVATAQNAGAVVVLSERGRGAQLRAGAAAASGELLWFLHADTLSPPAAALGIEEALRDPRVVGGAFTVRFSGDSRGARFFTRAAAVLRRIGLGYGDAGIFVRRDAYDRVGGIAPFPLFEDLDLVRRLQRAGKFVILPAAVVTSSRRFEGRAARTLFLWVWLHVLYWLGVPPVVLARLYRRK